MTGRVGLSEVMEVIGGQLSVTTDNGFTVSSTRDESSTLINVLPAEFRHETHARPGQRHEPLANKQEAHHEMRQRT